MIPEAGHETIKLSPEAHEYREMIDLIADHTSVLPDTSNAFKGHLGKWRTNFTRLLLTLHMFDAAARDLKQPPELVAPAMAANAAKLMTQFFLPNAARFYAEISGESTKRNDARWIAGYILSRDEPIAKISERDIGRAFNALLDNKDGIERAMNSLIFYGWVRPIEKKGRPPTRWEVNPRVYTIFGEQAAIEKERRRLERERIQEAIRFLGLGKTETPQ